MNEPNLKILYDFYHAQLINGQITHTLKSLHEQNLVGHIQVSQPIGRHEPNTEGELNFDYIFKLLKEFKLDVYIGAGMSFLISILLYPSKDSIKMNMSVFRVYGNTRQC